MGKFFMMTMNHLKGLKYLMQMKALMKIKDIPAKRSKALTVPQMYLYFQKTKGKYYLLLIKRLLGPNAQPKTH